MFSSAAGQSRRILAVAQQGGHFPPLSKQIGKLVAPLPATRSTKKQNATLRKTPEKRHKKNEQRVHKKGKRQKPNAGIEPATSDCWFRTFPLHHALALLILMASRDPFIGRRNTF